MATIKSFGITDTTFRDAHQSLLATRLKTEDMEPIASRMDEIGFASMEVWGGATFDVATRYLGEDPWDRLRLFKKLITKTPLSMLLRGQSLVGYKAYADDVVDAFITRSAENGIDIFRVFDALNDEWNLSKAAESVKDNNKHLQMTICYSVTESGKMGGPIYNLDYYLDKAKSFQNMGADSLCIKDMAGLLSPYDAFELISELKKKCDNSPATAYPLHKRHGLDDRFKSNRSRHRRGRCMPCPISIKNLPTSGRTAGCHNARDPK